MSIVLSGLIRVLVKRNVLTINRFNANRVLIKSLTLSTLPAVNCLKSLNNNNYIKSICFSRIVPKLSFNKIFVDIERGLTSCGEMPPLSGQSESDKLDQLIKDNKVVVFSKSYCPFCRQVKSLFDELNVDKYVVELDQIEDGPELHEALKAKVGRNSVPQVFISGQHIGGCDDTIKAKDDGLLVQLLKSHDFDYDLIVIGGGSGGLAASKEAVKYNKRVAVLDFVPPTPLGTNWGLGGTCVNVGCIPKKLMHTAALIGEALKDAPNYGWNLPENITHDWVRMKDEIQNYVKSINFGYRVALREKKVDYINALASFVDPHKIKCVDKKGKESFLTAETFIIATGERPRYPDIPGVKEYCITSDDLFSLPYCPGKTLVIGASYVALECAGFLRGLGLDVTVMVRSILLRGFDQEMAEKVGNYMSEEGIKFIRPSVPQKVEQIESGQPAKLRVTAQKVDTNEVIVEEFNTVLFAIGRNPCTDNIGLENTGVIKEKNGKIKTNNEQTNIGHIYAIGDILYGKPELTPVAIEAGTLLARRLYANSAVQCDYINVPTTVFTPLEYGACGYSEEAAVEKFGEENIEVYIQNFIPLEWQVPHRKPVNACFAKLICLKSENDRLLGFHYLGPNAGEVTQLIGLSLKMRATKSDINALIGIHPTCAEVFTTLVVTKRSGLSPEAKGC